MTRDGHPARRRSKIVAMRRLLVSLSAALILCTNAPAQRVNVDGATQTFNVVSSQYFDEVYFRFSPTAGTSAGLHTYDTQLEDYSAANMTKWVAALRQYQSKIEAIPADGLDAPVAADREILLNSIRSQLLNIETIHMWQKNPDNYSSGVTSSIFTLIERPYAPVNTRLHAAIAREKAIPQVFAEARQNLANPPKIYTEIALEQIDGSISFFEHDVPLAFAGATDAAAKAEFARTNAAVIDALKSYAAWMKSDLLPRSNGDFRFGADTYRKKLAYDEMVDTPLDRLLAINDVNMKANQAEFARIAKELDPTKTPQKCWHNSRPSIPRRTNCWTRFATVFPQRLRLSGRITSSPSPAMCVRPCRRRRRSCAPPLRPASIPPARLSPAPRSPTSMSPCRRRGGRRNTSPSTWPSSTWAPSSARAFTRRIPVTTCSSCGRTSSPPRSANCWAQTTNIEGWAHYCEQMMLDEGYVTPGSDDRERKLIRLGQLQDALLRNARFVVGIKMHTEGWTTEQAERYFVTEGYQSSSVGAMETKRGTADATYLYYTLGKLEIMKLREDAKKKQGAAFTLQGFHDSFMRQGPAPHPDCAAGHAA